MTRQKPRSFDEEGSWALWDGAESTTVDEAFDIEDPSAQFCDLVISAVRTPRCFVVRPDKPNRRAVLILAGGGYTKLVVGKEGFEVAIWLAGLGYHAFVLVHRFPSAVTALGSATGAQAPVDDAIEAMRQIRARSAEFGIEPNRVGAVGLSSGGHLAACLITRYPKHWVAPASAVARFDWRPDFLIVGYGPISTNATGRTLIPDKPALVPSQKQELYDTMQPDADLVNKPPPTFLFYAADDPIVPVDNGRRLHAALESKQVYAELHIFAHAPHGFALRKPFLPVGSWPLLCEIWLRQIGMHSGPSSVDLVAPGF